MTQSNPGGSIAATAIPIGLLAVLFSTMAPFFFGHTPWIMASYKYIYCAGAAVMLVTRLFTPYRGDDFRLKRLHRIEAWIPIIFGVGAFFLFYRQDGLRDWIAFTLAGAVLQIYTSIAIPLREARILKERNSRG